ncbi:MAG TPA: BBP7 family outer membrane beta-barrel protein [Gemmataceae bacterium]|nr:BBP7 family outer membrane beta-barrel protein [Gemmataceae bacterium]
MSRFRLASLTLSLGLVASAACADDGDWGPPPPDATTPRTAAPAAQLGRPVVAAPADPLVQPANYDAVYRGQAPDAQPLPVGPGEPIAQPRDYQRPMVGGPFPGPTMAPQGPFMPAQDCDDCGCHPLAWLFHADGCGCGGGESCGGGACDGCGDCGCCDTSRFYISAEYLLWWAKGDPLPPLVTAGSPGDLLVPGISAGALGLPGTTILFGNSDANAGGQSGARIMAGWWFGDQHCLGIEGGGFVFGRQTDDFTATSFGSPLLARPFFNVLTGTQDVEFVAEPGNPAVTGVAARPPLVGTVSASASSSFWGAEANLRTNLWCGPNCDLDLIGGYRYLGLDDKLSVGESLQAFNVATPFVFSGTDSFQTTNRFNGGQIGLKGEWHFGRWSLDGKTIIALGDMSERVDINGFKVVNGVGSAGDLLTQVGTNIGVHQRNRFAWSPEVGLNLGYQITDHCRFFVGYDFLYVSDVVRAGNQVNLNVNPLPLAGVAGGPTQPAFVFHPTDFWAQGVNFGLQFRY